MKLEHIKEVSCPVCPCSKIVGERKEKQHTNEQWNETREFECGCVLKYSPNFAKTNIWTECLNDPVLKEKAENRGRARTKLITYINRLEVDDEFKERLVDELKGYLYR